MNHRRLIAKRCGRAAKIIFIAAVSLSILAVIFMSQASADTAPNITYLNSLTHPDQNKWYSNNDPVFDWDSFDLSSQGIYDTPGFAQAVAVQGNLAYVADGASGMQIVDVSNPALNPLPLTGSIDTTGTAYGVAVNGQYAYIADGTSGLKIINISNPASPSLTGSISVGGTARDMAVTDQYVYVAVGSSGLKIVNVADHAHPALVGSYDSPGTAYGVAVVGQYAYLMDGTAGVNVVDVSRAEVPFTVATLDTPDSARQIKIVGNRGYVADALSGLQILDTSDVLHPTIIGSYKPGSDCRSVAVSGNNAFVVDQSLGLFALDISDPAHVTLRNSIDTPGAAYAVTVANGHAFVGDYSSGLEAFSIHSPAYSYLIDAAQTTVPDTTSEGSGVSAQINDVVDGVQYFHVRAGDGMGNWGQTSHFRVKVDAAAPSVYGISSTGAIGSESAVVTAYYGDSMSGIDTGSAGITVSGGSISDCDSDGGRIQCTASGLAAGIHDVNVSVADNAGNVGTGSASFTGGLPDTVAPTVTNILPAGMVTGDSAVVSAYFNDPVPSSGINTSSASMIVYGGTVSDCSVTATGMSCTASGLAPGTHGVEVSVSDNTGNTGAGSGSFDSKSASIAYRWTWYDSINMQDWILIANPTGAAKNLEFDLSIGKEPMGLGNLGFGEGVVPQGETLRPTYSNMMDGPVTAASKNGAQAIVSQRSLRGDSFEEVLGTEKQSSHFYWTWYDMNSAGFQNWILIANPGSEPVHAQISFTNQADGSAVAAQYDIEPGQNWTPTFPGKMGGPVEVKANAVGGSWDNPGDRRDVIASQRVLSNGGAAFNEVPGIPEDELSDSYLWTWYDQKTPGFQDWVLIANPNDIEVSYQIDIASGAEYGAGATQYGTIPAHGKVTPQFPNVRNGAVKVTASGNVIASQRSIAGPSFEEVPGYPESSLTSDYHWTWYDMLSAGSMNWVMISNPSGEAVHARISFTNEADGSAVAAQYDIAPGQNWTPTFSGKMGGPVEVKANRVGGSWSTVADRRDVMVSQRVLWRGFFNEVLGTVLK